MPFQDTMILKLYSITSGVSCNKSNFSLTFTHFVFSSQYWEEKKPSDHPFLSQKHEGALTTRGSSGQEPQPSSRGITYKIFWSRWGEPAMNHRAPSTGTSHGGTIVELVVCITVDTRSNGQSSYCRPAGRARDTLSLDSDPQSESTSASRWSASGSDPPRSAYNPSWTTGDLNRPLFWQHKGPGLVPGKLNRCYLNHGTCIHMTQVSNPTKARIYNTIRGNFVGSNNCTTYKYASIISIIVALLVWLLAFCNLRYESH
jgi:hypothetical protein